MSAADPTKIQPLAPFIKIDANGAPYLEGLQCVACGEVIVSEARRACPKCATVGALQPARLSERGALYSYTVVRRSFPGVKTPFISALVDLEGGGAIKGNLMGVAPDPEAIAFGMPVRVVFEEINAPADHAQRLVRHIFLPDIEARSTGAAP